MRLLDVHPGLLPRRSGQAVAPGWTSRVVAPRGLPLRDSAGVPPASRLRHGGRDAACVGYAGSIRA